ncbi:uncharacterized protein LOC121649164 [Melanotaenia boesemani]|uniref:uncharacterized protein LOC121649164 n=1 Tax=Melanotaenia boesemani TaxID=1250792 RepID=UPI001C058055|nr:uncharacterized protein LOC121649164 [Melanotaenia boesemani]
MLQGYVNFKCKPKKKTQAKSVEQHRREETRYLTRLPLLIWGKKMSKPKRTTRFSFTHSRRRQVAANDRKFCIMWLNKMVKKQVEKHYAKLREEFSVLSQELREQMAAEITKQPKESVAEEARAHSQLYTVLYKEEDDEEKSLDQITLSSNSSETHFYTNHIDKKLTKLKTDNNLRVLLEDSTDSDSRDTDLADDEAMHGFTDSHGSSHQTEQLMERLWTEWMDNKERTGNLEENPHDQLNCKKQGGARPREPGKPMKEMTKVESTNTVKKMRTYISNVFNPHRQYKWKKLEEEDSTL